MPPPTQSSRTSLPLLLRHVHLPSREPSYVPYQLAAHVQSRLRDAALASKNHADLGPRLPPVLVSFTPPPTYTLGRRQGGSGEGAAGGGLSAADLARLKAPLEVRRRGAYGPPGCGRRRREGREGEGDDLATPPPPPLVFDPLVLPTLRGGLATYHGPGQAVLWPVLDLARLRFTKGSSDSCARGGAASGGGSGDGGGQSGDDAGREALGEGKAVGGRGIGMGGVSVRDYVCALESATMRSLAALYGLEAGRTADPGVWVLSASGGEANDDVSKASSPRPPATTLDTDHVTPSDDDAPPYPRKVAAVGVHLRRRVTGLGTAVNLSTPTTGGEASNPWRRFVACGLEGKGVTSVAREVAEMGRAGGAVVQGGGGAIAGEGSRGVDNEDVDGGDDVGSAEGVERFAFSWAEQLAALLGMDGVERVSLGPSHVQDEGRRSRGGVDDRGRGEVDDAPLTTEGRRVRQMVLDAIAEWQQQQQSGESGESVGEPHDEL